MKIAVGVHGRFSAFHAAEGLLEAGAQVRLFTNYPRTVVQRFGFPSAHTTSLVRHGVAARIAHNLHVHSVPIVESALMRGFGRWLARGIGEFQPDVAWCWSGVAEETFRSTTSLRALTRSSFHIVAQQDLLAQEAARTGSAVEQPSDWIMAREQREYALADVIVVPSTPAKRSFAPFMDISKVVVVPLTADLRSWQPAESVVRERQRRLLAGEPLRVLYAGNISFQKGMFDMAQVVDKLHGTMSFRFTGNVTGEARGLVKRLSSIAQFDGHVPESRLRDSYAWADVFMFASIHDGFAVVLAQAAASALPFISTANTGAADLIEAGAKGWVVPIRDADAIAERLLWCDAHRDALVEMTGALYENPPRRSWRDVAEELLAVWSVPR